MPNPPNNTLDLANVINVSILPTPVDLGIPNINTAALFSLETPTWSGSQDYKVYLNASDVATDFGSGSKAAAIATAFFAQQPNPLNTGGYLAIITRQAGPETVQAAILRTLNLIYYFGILIDEEMESVPLVFASLTAYVQTLDKMFFYASSFIADLNPGSMLDLVRQAVETHTRTMYYHTATALDTQRFSAAYAGRALSTDFSGSATTMTMHLKQLATIVPDQTVGQTQLLLAKTAGVDVYVSVAGVPGTFTSGANAFFDEIYNEFWFKFALQVAGFNILAGTNFKIPQTEQGMDTLKDAYRAVCNQGVINSFAAPGAWTSPDLFGDPAALVRSVGDIGYYVFSSPVAKQSPADRVARKAPLVQIAIKAAGAIHSSNVIVNVNL